MPAELALRDGYLTPRGLPDGECIITSLYGDDGMQTGIRIDHADPRVLISAEVLDAIMDGSSSPATLYRPRTLAGSALYESGTLLKIPGVNRTVVYRVTEYVPAINAYIAEWPD